jgi:hypothetical protein
MCVIASKPIGIEIPSDDMIAKMWQTNPDGAGFMYTLKKRVYIEKGFMNLKEFTNAIAGLEKRLRKHNEDIKNIPLVMHFRITTHGGTSAPNTHPFPISPDRTLLTSLDITTELAMAHNGIINSVSAFGDLSDTQTYIQDVLSPLHAYDGSFYKNPHMQTLMENTIDGSRLVFLDKFGALTYIGDWKEKDGMYFSNLHFDRVYEPYRSGKMSPYAWSFNRSFDDEPVIEVRPKTIEGDCDTCFVEKYSQKVPVIALPVGTLLATYEAFDAQLTTVVIDRMHTETKEITEENTYFVDNDGYVYRRFDDDKNYMYLVNPYEYAVDESTDGSIEFIDAHLLNMHGYDYITLSYVEV